MPAAKAKLRRSYGGNIWERSLSVFFFSSSSCVVRSRIKSSKLFEYCSNILNMVSTMFTFLQTTTMSTGSHALVMIAKLTYLPPLSDLMDWARSLNDGRVSACSAQHCFIELIYSGGATCLDTEGRNNGGGFLIFAMISTSKRRSLIVKKSRFPNEYETLWR